MLTTNSNANDPANQIEKLSQQVSQIATSLVRLSAGIPASPEGYDATKLRDAAEISDTVERVMRARARRFKYFPADLFADPAWDIMLSLFKSAIDQRRVSVSELCMAAQVPPTTGLRWIRSMEQQGLLVRQSDPLDGRRVFIELALHVSDALYRYFTDAIEAGRHENSKSAL